VLCLSATLFIKNQFITTMKILNFIYFLLTAAISSSQAIINDVKIQQRNKVPVSPERNSRGRVSSRSLRGAGNNDVFVHANSFARTEDQSIFEETHEKQESGVQIQEKNAQKEANLKVKEGMLHSEVKERNLMSAHELFHTSPFDWNLEQWIFFFILLFVLSFVLGIMQRIHCCGCSLVDCLVCYCCYEIFCDPTPGYALW